MCRGRLPAGRHLGPLTEVPGREVSQGRRARGGRRAPRAREPHNWHLVDLGESKEKFPRGWGDPRVLGCAAWDAGTCFVLPGLCWRLSQGKQVSVACASSLKTSEMHNGRLREGCFLGQLELVHPGRRKQVPGAESCWLSAYCLAGSPIAKPQTAKGHECQHIP